MQRSKNPWRFLKHICHLPNSIAQRTATKKKKHPVVNKNLTPRRTHTHIFQCITKRKPQIKSIGGIWKTSCNHYNRDDCNIAREMRIANFVAPSFRWCWIYALVGVYVCAIVRHIKMFRMLVAGKLHFVQVVLQLRCHRWCYCHSTKWRTNLYSCHVKHVKIVTQATVL